MESQNYYIYILASGRNGTLYIGVTNNLARRVQEHKSDLIDGFTKQHKVHDLVYYESTENPEAAIAREKVIKSWNRKWKMDLLEKDNPGWRDLYEDII